MFILEIYLFQIFCDIGFFLVSHLQFAKTARHSKDQYNLGFSGIVTALPQKNMQFSASIQQGICGKNTVLPSIIKLKFTDNFLVFVLKIFAIPSPNQTSYNLPGNIMFSRPKWNPFSVGISLFLQKRSSEISTKKTVNDLNVWLVLEKGRFRTYNKSKKGKILYKWQMFKCH